MKVSIIIPVYNAATTLRRCVESLIYGEEKDIELILVEDCSTDESWGLCCQLQEEYCQIKAYKNACNQGVSYTRNFGLSQANGQYILFVDSDDWVSGNYVFKMITEAQRHEGEFVICGFHFINRLSTEESFFSWSSDVDKSIARINNSHLFELQKKTLLQQLWNKVFVREVIIKNNVRFDETQSMGEDFQFVLDYIENANITSFVVLNDPLYYYVRTNNTSLMSRFGLQENTQEYRRLLQLRKISGEDNIEIQKKYEKALLSLKYNYIYQAVHSNKAKKEKICFIESVMKDGRASEYYSQQMRVVNREKVYSFYSKLKSLPERGINRLKRGKRDHIAMNMKKRLHNKNVSIISQNCIGGVFYHDMGMNFYSPTINLFFSGPDFIKLVNELQYYVSLPLKMSWGEKYPIGYLDDIAIHFMHYESCSEARSAWERRVKRINYKKILVLCTDMEDFNDETYRMWNDITYPKLLFSATKRDDESVLFYPEYEKQGKVDNLIPDRKFYKDGKLIEVVNQLQ